MPETSSTPPIGGGDIEVEWQFDALDLRPVERWLAALHHNTRLTADLPTLTALAGASRRLVDHYLDTQDWRIGRAGFVLRTRARGRRDEATLKDSRPAGAGGLRQRLEVTEDLGPKGIGALGPNGPVGRRVHAVAGSRPLQKVLEVRTRRRPYSLRVDGEEVAEVALDETMIIVEATDQPVRLRRVEIEVVPAWVGRLQPLVDDVRTSCGLQPATLSKFEAGLMALGVTVPGPVELGSTVVTPDSSMGELAFAVLRRHLGVLLAREPGTRLGDDVEELHDMRVATRRLRAALDLFVDVLPARATLLRSELGWLAGVLGTVRDLDVQLARMDEMDSWVAPADTTDPRSPLQELRRVLEVERTGQRALMLEALESPRWERLASGLTTMARQGPSKRQVAARQPAALIVPDLVAARHQAVAKAARKAKRTGIPDDFHRLRIRGKRLRYSLEFTSAVYGARTDRFVRRLAQLQDQLGLMQDAEVATNRLRDLAVEVGSTLPPATIFAMGEVAERYHQEADTLLGRLPRHLRILSGPEWEDLVGLMERRQAEAAEAIAQANAPASPVAVAEPPTADESETSRGESLSAIGPTEIPLPHVASPSGASPSVPSPAIPSTGNPRATNGGAPFSGTSSPWTAPGPLEALTPTERTGTGE